jgi:galactofuranose transport system substrate-binding protein
MPRSRQFARRPVTATALAMLVLAAGACTKSADDGDSPGGKDAAQQVQATSGGTGCTPEKYNGGVPKLDLKNITVGFAQSEKEANPFRITETQSIKDEAAKRGIKLITTNAQSDLNKEIADIQGMIAQGAKALIISPLNSEGLDPALKAAQDAKVPVMTIDRLLTTKAACKDYLGWIGSDFVKQGERAADAMIKATGDQGDVAILLGASGVNVTVDRTKGFKDQLTAKASKLKIVAEQTGDFTREKGQKVTEQLISANPQHHRHLRRERRDGAGRGGGAQGREQETG